MSARKISLKTFLATHQGKPTKKEGKSKGFLLETGHFCQTVPGSLPLTTENYKRTEQNKWTINAKNQKIKNHKPHAVCGF